MRIVCARCGRPGDAVDVDVAQNLLLCKHCDDVVPLGVAGKRAEGNAIIVPEDFSPDFPPDGAWYEREADGVRAGAKCGGDSGFRSRSFLFLVMLILTAAAIVVYCVVSALDEDNGYLKFFSGLLAVASLGPFLAVFGMFFLIVLSGRTEIFIGASGGWVFTGIGLLGYRQCFQLDEIMAVCWRKCGSEREIVLGKVVHGRTVYCPQLRRRAGKTIEFGSFLSAARQEYLGCVVALLLRQRIAGD